ncbi:hypothetical protein [Clostridium niameyense]|uniref:hypothetical protein n=1 Tax=Clostridium niameyense TaxID=1622073 RepID=UPI00067F19D5|nr:hypothetical protein [Clostridium niameyense]
MKKPILFNTEMVEAILSGRKTTTRRIIKDVSSRLNFIGTSSEDGVIFNHAIFGHGDIDDIANVKVEKRIKAPYLPGDILWVRETWKVQSLSNMNYRAKFLYKAKPNYKLKTTNVDSETYIKLLRYESKNGWHPSIFMPKVAARIFLKVKEVRIERLQGLDYQGALGEGIIGYDGWTSKFKELWNSTLKKEQLNKYSWNSDPWVWVIEFERIEDFNE